MLSRRAWRNSDRLSWHRAGIPPCCASRACYKALVSGPRMSEIECLRTKHSCKCGQRPFCLQDARAAVRMFEAIPTAVRGAKRNKPSNMSSVTGDDFIYRADGIGRPARATTAGKLAALCRIELEWGRAENPPAFYCCGCVCVGDWDIASC